LLRTVKQRAEIGEVVAKRDYAILLFFVMTGLRRNEVLGLVGKDLEFREGRFLARCKVKGGDFVWRRSEVPRSGMRFSIILLHVKGRRY